MKQTTKAFIMYSKTHIRVTPAEIIEMAKLLGLYLVKEKKMYAISFDFEIRLNSSR